MIDADIERMAREAGAGWPDDSECEMTRKQLHHFARLVAAHERERCAVVCDGIKAQYNDGSTGDDAAASCAAAIRAL